MKRDAFIQMMNDTMAGILAKHKEKNVAYGQDNDAFHNFRSSAIRIFGADTPENMYKVLLTLVDKHLVALANGGLTVPEFKDRTTDVIVYMHIALGIFQEYEDGLVKCGPRCDQRIIIEPSKSSGATKIL